MKRIFAVLTAVLMVFASISFAVAQQADAPKKAVGKPGIIIVDEVVVTATVEAVNYEKRTVALKGPEGKIKTVKIDKDVKNFDQIKVGDKVTATFYESTAVYVRKSDAPPGEGEVASVRVAPKGKKPGVVAVDTIQITAKIEAIDYKKRSLTLKGPEGNAMTFKVDKGVKNFDQVKKGDEVVIRNTEALAIKVEKP